MAVLDADVSELLSALLVTAVAPRALQAITMIVLEDEEEARLGGAAPLDRRTRWGQLDIADRIIADGIKLEITATRRLRELAPRFQLENISIARGEATAATSLPGPSLIDPAREDALSEFLLVWEQALRGMRQRWELDGGE
jgi:hypothetical protein